MARFSRRRSFGRGRRGSFKKRGSSRRRKFSNYRVSRGGIRL